MTVKSDKERAPYGSCEECPNPCGHNPAIYGTGRYQQVDLSRKPGETNRESDALMKSETGG